MKLIDGLVIVEKQNDYKKYDIILDLGFAIKLRGVGTVFFNKENKTYPQFYKLRENYEVGFNGTYFEIDKQEAYEIIEDYIEKKRQEIYSLLDILPYDDD